MCFYKRLRLLHQIGCAYCRLIYTGESVTLEAIIPVTDLTSPDLRSWIQSILSELFFVTSCLGGVLQTETSINQRVIQVALKVPYRPKLGQPLKIQCHLPVLQLAFTHLAFLAGLIVCTETNEEVPLLTDDVTQVQAAKHVLWVQQEAQVIPKGIKARVDLSTSPVQLRHAVEAVVRGEAWGNNSESRMQRIFSERKLEILTLLTQGHRDRDIADRLIISESTVKFHMNNVLAKLKVRTQQSCIGRRYRAIRMSDC